MDSRSLDDRAPEPGVRQRRDQPGTTVDTTLAALELAAAGAGCALAHRVFLAPYVSTGRLVAAIDREFADDNSYFVVTRSGRSGRGARWPCAGTGS